MMEGDSPPIIFFFAAQSNPTLVTTTSRLIAKPCQRNVPQGQPCNSHCINERISLAIVLDNKLITICTMKISSHKRNATHQMVSNRRNMQRQSTTCRLRRQARETAQTDDASLQSDDILRDGSGFWAFLAWHPASVIARYLHRIIRMAEFQ